MIDSMSFLLINTIIVFSLYSFSLYSNVSIVNTDTVLSSHSHAHTLVTSDPTTIAEQFCVEVANSLQVVLQNLCTVCLK